MYIYMIVSNLFASPFWISPFVMINSKQNKKKLTTKVNEIIGIIMEIQEIETFVLFYMK